jgi:DNA-binding PadR family transcriptional regulator
MAQEDLDRKAKLVLEAVYELGGEADTSEILDYTGIDSNGVVHYRYDKLEEAELVETRTVDRGGTLDVTVATLTDRGHDRVGHILEDGEGLTVVERVEALREVVMDLHDDVRQFEGRLDAVEDRLDEVNSRFESVEEVDALREDVEDTLAELEVEVGERKDARQAVQDVVAANDVLEYAGLIERDSSSEMSRGPTSANFRRLWHYGVFGSLVDATTPKSGTYRGPWEGEEAEEIDWNELPVDEQEVPEW